MANIDDSDEPKEQPGRIVNAGEPDSDTGASRRHFLLSLLLLHFCGW